MQKQWSKSGRQEFAVTQSVIYENYSPYITPTMREVDAVVRAGANIVATVTGQIDIVNGVVARTNGAIPGWEGVHLVKELQLESGLALPDVQEKTEGALLYI